MDNLKGVRNVSGRINNIVTVDSNCGYVSFHKDEIVVADHTWWYGGPNSGRLCGIREVLRKVDGGFVHLSLFIGSKYHNHGHKPWLLSRVKSNLTPQEMGEKIALAKEQATRNYSLYGGGLIEMDLDGIHFVFNF